MGELKILAPYNFTTHEYKALNFIINTFGHRKDSRVTFFHCFLPLPQLDVTSDPSLLMARSGMQFLREELDKKEAGILSAKRRLMDNGFSADQVDFIFRKREKSIAAEIADTVTKGNYGVLVLAPTPGKVKKLFAQSVHEKAIKALKDVTICVVL